MEPFLCEWHCLRIMSAPHLNSETRFLMGLAEKQFVATNKTRQSTLTKVCTVYNAIQIVQFGSSFV